MMLKCILLPLALLGLLLTPSVLTLPAQGAVLPAADSGRIYGEVWNDTNGNGLIDAGEPAVVGARVKLVLEGTVIATDFSDGLGQYEFTNLPANTYGVNQQQPLGFPYSTTPNIRTVILPEDGAAEVNFGEWVGLRSWLPLLMR